MLNDDSLLKNSYLDAEFARLHMSFKKIMPYFQSRNVPFLGFFLFKNCMQNSNRFQLMVGELRKQNQKHNRHFAPLLRATHD